LDWDDLKYLIAVADAGGLTPAARALCVDPSTVSRRITALEKALGAELVARTPEGMALTAAGHLAEAAARSIEAQLVGLAAEIGGTRDEPAGIVRVSTTDSFAPAVFRAFAQLARHFPQLAIEVVPSTQTVDLRRREADLAVRFFRDDHDGLALRKLGVLGWSLYASQAYLAEHPSGSTLLGGHDVVAYTDALRAMPGAQWLATHAAPEAVRVRCGNVRAALEATVAGIGVGILPCYLHAAQPSLVRMTDQVLGSSEAYAVFLLERRGEARLRVVIDALVGLFERERTSFCG
jgi:DNA-binding transcriptional LysR family regulator